MGVSLQLERERLRAVLQPNFPADNSLDAIIDLTSDRAVVNSECHWSAKELRTAAIICEHRKWKSQNF